jgi:hypothetical protein
MAEGPPPFLKVKRSSVSLSDPSLSPNLQKAQTEQSPHGSARQGLTDRLPGSRSASQLPRELREHRAAIDFALPHDHHAPAQHTQFSRSASIASFVSKKFLAPERASRLGQDRIVTSVMMPEAAVNKYNGAASREYHVWCSGKISTMQPVSKSARVQVSSNDHLRLRVSVPNRLHIPPTSSRDARLSHSCRSPSDSVGRPVWADTSPDGESEEP